MRARRPLSVHASRFSGCRSCFERAGAAETPEVLGEFIDQDVFGGVDGPMFDAEAAAEFVKFGLVLAGHDQVFGVKAVFEGVAGRIWLSLQPVRGPVDCWAFARLMAGRSETGSVAAGSAVSAVSAVSVSQAACLRTSFCCWRSAARLCVRCSRAVMGLDSSGR